MLFLGMLKRTCDVYGDCMMHDIGLAPISMASPPIIETQPETHEESWARDFDR